MTCVDNEKTASLIYEKIVRWFFFRLLSSDSPLRVLFFSFSRVTTNRNQKSKKSLLLNAADFFYSSSYFIDMIDVILKLTIRHEDKHLEIPTTSTSTHKVAKVVKPVGCAA